MCRIPNGVPALSDEVSDQTAHVVIGAGRFTNQKGFERLVSAWEHVAPSHQEWELRIFGDGPHQAALERQIAKAGLNGRVKLMGRTSQMPVGAGAGLDLRLSFCFEGFPMVLIEALGAGLPAVKLHRPRGPRDVIDDGHNGLLVPPGDVTAMAAGLSRLMDDEQLRRKMAVAARETAGHYSMDQVGELWRTLFADLGLPPHRPARGLAPADRRRRRQEAETKR